MTRSLRFMTIAALAVLAAPVAHAAPQPGDRQFASLDAVGMQTIDTTSLSGQQTMSAMPTRSLPASALVVQAHAQRLRPAPLPDPDYDAPGPDSQAVAAQGATSVRPSFYSAAQHFSGDGFASGSTLDEDRAAHHHAGGGMSLSIPVQ